MRVVVHFVVAEGLQHPLEVLLRTDALAVLHELLK